MKMKCSTDFLRSDRSSSGEMLGINSGIFGILLKPVHDSLSRDKFKRKTTNQYIDETRLGISCMGVTSRNLDGKAWNLKAHSLQLQPPSSKMS
ncbi:predicted protein [Sclerotinia sclerotiorum 1980 UF-70]|uniref:Uncharacterized protein n=1 Tax=Sclerotinia sclerotiorum (strain ATCC 18683 / 1980 / Ss-1) TaxID=665079 RepID=A7E673_SCLS1|nr:predicted protein [Sclerotinia sclerotiorum 1980 UF-70]EDN91395.1 predicted protein [Sclerotinia sclerotiorum 1980 UF-70]